MEQQQEPRIDDRDDEEAAAADGQLVYGMTPAECLQLAVELQLLTEATLLQHQRQQLQQQQGQELFQLQVALLVTSNQLLQQLLQCCAAAPETRSSLQQLLSGQDVLLLPRALAAPVQPGLCEAMMRVTGSHLSPGHQLFTLRISLEIQVLGERC
jgi:hypothetical protein